MHREGRIGCRAATVVLLGLLCAVFGSPPAEADHGYVPVFEPVSRLCECRVLRCVTAPYRPARVARLAPRFLAQLRAPPVAEASPTKEARRAFVAADFNLPWGERIRVLLRPRRLSCDRFVWLGKRTQETLQPVEVILSVYRGVCGRRRVGLREPMLVATLRVGNRTVEVLPHGEGGLYLIREPIFEDERKQEHWQGPKVPAAMKVAEKPAAAKGKALPTDQEGGSDDALADCPSTDGMVTIDVLVVHSPGAVALAGGDGALRGRIHDAVTRTNLAFDNSKAQACLRVVACRFTKWNPAIVESEIEALVAGTELAPAIIHKWREQYGADLVVLVTDRQGGSNGLAMRRTTCSIDGGEDGVDPWAAYGYALVDANGMQSRYSFTHEIGHFLGCGHPLGGEVPTNLIAPFALGYGCAASDAGCGTDGCCWGTIECVDGSARIPYFSSADDAARYADAPVGALDEADNAAVIRATAGLVAKYREPPP